MSGTAMRICAATILMAVLFFGGRATHADTDVRPPPPWRIERDIRRFNAVANDNVLNALGIRPGMTILEIGAGTGQFSYEFARLAGGAGKVFAADTNAGCIEYMKEESRKRGLENLLPVLVRKDGMDPFYGQHKYDLITVIHVSMAYKDKVDYFRELRGYLAENGRLVLILYKIPAPFALADFTGDFRGLLAELSLESVESPYYKILKASTRKLMSDNPGAEPSEVLKASIVEDFKEALFDPGFTSHFYAGSVYRKKAAFTPEQERYADWLLLSFPDSSALNRRVKPGNAVGTNMYALINKLLIEQRYRKFFKRDGMFLSGFSTPMRAAFEKAGYRVEKEYTSLIPFEDMIILADH